MHKLALLPPKLRTKFIDDTCLASFLRTEMLNDVQFIERCIGAAYEISISCLLSLSIHYITALHACSVHGQH